jgi:hypothetical protein
MSSLTPEAYAVIEGRPSDPFHYLGPHVDDDGSVVRVFLPDVRHRRRAWPRIQQSARLAPSASIPSSTCASRPVSTVSIGSQI